MPLAPKHWTCESSVCQMRYYAPLNHPLGQHAFQDEPGLILSTEYLTRMREESTTFLGPQLILGLVLFEHPITVIFFNELYLLSVYLLILFL